MTANWVYRMLLVIFVLPGTIAPLQVQRSLFADADHVAVILIVDNSGSMKTSDSGGLRFTGVRLFASLLDAKDSLGLILFSTQAELLTDGLVILDSQADKKIVLENLNFQAANGYTDIKAAFEEAKQMLEEANLQDEKTVIVLLTDGQPEISNPYPQYEAETLELARSLNIPVRAIALTTAAQTPYLDQLASATNGGVIPADNSSDLLNAYLQVLGQIKDRTVIGGEKFQGNSSLEIDPALAPYINSVTFVIGKPENTTVRLLSPNGHEITANTSNVKFVDSSDSRFSLFTLENPVGGTYSFRTQGGGTVQVWAILRSRLRIGVIEPGQIHPLGRELPVVVNLLEETTQGKFIKIIGEANFTALITRPDGDEVSLDRFYDDGTHGDSIANDGDFTRTYPGADAEGAYLISIQGWKDSVPVQVETRANILRFPEFVVDAPLEKVEVRGEPVELRIHLDGGHPNSFDQGEVVARVTSPADKVDEILMQGDEVLTGEYMPMEDGEYRITFETRQVKFQGVDYQTDVEYMCDVSVIPFLEAKVSETNIPSTCFASPSEIIVSLNLVSSGEETLHFSVPDGWRVLPETAKVKPGEQNVQLLLFANNRLTKEINEAVLLIEGRSRLEVQPDAMIGVEFQIPNVWARCHTPISLGGTALLIAVVGVFAIQRVRKAALPLPVKGTLRHWVIEGNPTQVVDIDLTAFGKHALLIGSGATCDVMIPHAELASEHARFGTERISDGVEVYLEPIGDVRKGYSQQIARFILHHGETFHMGTREFQYLSDSGE